MRSSGGSFTHLRGCRLDRAQDTVMRTAPADVVVERQRDLTARRRRVAVEERLGGDEDAGQAIAALARLLVEKGLLQRMRPLRGAEPLDRQHSLADDGRDGPTAGFHRLALDQHHAGAALLETAAEFCAGEAEMVAQDVEQRRVRIGGDARRLAVHREGYRLHPCPQARCSYFICFYRKLSGART